MHGCPASELQFIGSASNGHGRAVAEMLHPLNWYSGDFCTAAANVAGEFRINNPFTVNEYQHSVGDF